ncbi:hypothetical protein OF83DRAFT_1085480, partial [Amylostereum chailletii]
ADYRFIKGGGRRKVSKAQRQEQEDRRRREIRPLSSKYPANTEHCGRGAPMTWTLGFTADPHPHHSRPLPLPTLPPLSLPPISFEPDLSPRSAYAPHDMTQTVALPTSALASAIKGEHTEEQLDWKLDVGTRKGDLSSTVIIFKIYSPQSLQTEERPRVKNRSAIGIK